MHKVLEQISSFKDRVDFIAENLGTASAFIEDDEMTQEERYSIVEPYIEMLVESLSIKEKKVIIKQELKEIVEQLDTGNKISAIKLFRGYFDTGLKEAKDEVERVHSKDNMSWLVGEWKYNGELIRAKKRDR